MSLRINTAVHGNMSVRGKVKGSALGAVGKAVASVGYAMIGTSHYAVTCVTDNMAHDSYSGLGVSARAKLQDLSRQSASRTSEAFHRAVVSSAHCECLGDQNWVSNLVVACSHFASTMAAVSGSMLVTDRIVELASEAPKTLSDEETIDELVASVGVLLDMVKDACDSTTSVRRVLDVLEREEITRMVVFAENIGAISENDHYNSAQACLSLVHNMVLSLRQAVDNMLSAEGLILPEMTFLEGDRDSQPATIGTTAGGAGVAEAAFDHGHITVDLSGLVPVGRMAVPTNESSNGQIHRLIDQTQGWVNEFVECANQYSTFRTYFSVYQKYLNVAAIDILFATGRTSVDYDGLLAHLSESAELMRASGRDQELFSHHVNKLYNLMYKVVTRDQYRDLAKKERHTDLLAAKLDRMSRQIGRTESDIVRLTEQVNHQQHIYDFVFKYTDPVDLAVPYQAAVGEHVLASPVDISIANAANVAPDRDMAVDWQKYGQMGYVEGDTITFLGKAANGANVGTLDKTFKLDSELKLAIANGTNTAKAPGAQEDTQVDGLRQAITDASGIIPPKYKKDDKFTYTMPTPTERQHTHEGILVEFARTHANGVGDRNTDFAHKYTATSGFGASLVNRYKELLNGRNLDAMDRDAVKELENILAQRKANLEQNKTDNRDIHDRSMAYTDSIQELRSVLGSASAKAAADLAAAIAKVEEAQSKVDAHSRSVNSSDQVVTLQLQSEMEDAQDVQHEADARQSAINEALSAARELVAWYARDVQAKLEILLARMNEAKTASEKQLDRTQRQDASYRIDYQVLAGQVELMGRVLEDARHILTEPAQTKADEINGAMRAGHYFTARPTTTDGANPRISTYSSTVGISAGTSATMTAPKPPGKSS